MLKEAELSKNEKMAGDGQKKQDAIEKIILLFVLNNKIDFIQLSHY